MVKVGQLKYYCYNCSIVVMGRNNYFCHGDSVWCACHSVCKHDSAKSFEFILIKLCRRVEWGHVNNPQKYGLDFHGNLMIYWLEFDKKPYSLTLSLAGFLTVAFCQDKQGSSACLLKSIKIISGCLSV